MEILDLIRQRARQKQRKIVLPETTDIRVLKAAKVVVEEKLAQLIILSNDTAELKEKAQEIGLDLSRLEVVTPLSSEHLDEFSRTFYELRKHKGVSEEEALEQVKNPVTFAAMMVRFSLADGFVAGAITTTADVAKAAMYCVGFGEKVRTISSCFLICVPDCEYGEKGTFIFADCGVVPNPSPMQLANISASAADLFRILVQKEPRVALLSFSTKGSASHEMVDKITRTREIINEKFPDLIADGEFQLDAAIVPEVAKIKAPESSVAGSANVLIFPDLNAGNICYKMAQRLAKAGVIGPILNGLKKPCSDLSRGCTIDEIVDAVCTTSIRVVDEVAE